MHALRLVTDTDISNDARLFKMQRDAALLDVERLTQEVERLKRLVNQTIYSINFDALKLTFMEGALFNLLLGSAGRTVTAEAVFDEIRTFATEQSGYRPTDKRATARVRIAMLRKRLASTAAGSCWRVETAGYGRGAQGYKLVKVE